MKQISILGCGWLGFPLAKKFVKEGYKVKGATTSEVKLQTLKKSGIDPFQIFITSEGIQGEIETFLKSEILVVNLPPKAGTDSPEDFPQKMQDLIKFIEKSKVKNVIFVSSSSVYQDGPDFPVYTENDEPNSTNSEALISAEKLFFQNRQFKTTILRFGGLVGCDRHPIQYLSGKTEVKNPLAPVNLISQEDCIEIILKIVQNSVWNRVFNAVYPQHTSREDYYTLKAIEKGLELPVFDFEKKSQGKIMDSGFLKAELDFEFQYPV
ncbi:MAG TPA: NAD-dependent epimerase/dehydratase family protein [Salinimicrobium sp.]|nr:NAD-dependent epimerase/dehydratase family protein [Salinimicrobium sp.]